MGIGDWFKSKPKAPSEAEQLVTALATAHTLTRENIALISMRDTAFNAWWVGRYEQTKLAVRPTADFVEVYLGDADDETDLYLGHLGSTQFNGAKPVDPELAARFVIIGGEPADARLAIGAVKKQLLALSPHVADVSFFPKGLRLMFKNPAGTTAADVARAMQTMLPVLAALQSS